jgi:threonine/homoserine/homoserine lactone efflux protein
MILVYVLALVLMLVLSPIIAATAYVEKWLKRRRW